MTNQANEILNNVLIELARSFLQYISEAWPWVDPEEQDIEEQVFVLAARQRQDVAMIAELLNDREHPIDFGVFPTEYTDMQFLALDAILDKLLVSQEVILQIISDSIAALQKLGDEEGVRLLQVVQLHQQEDTEALKELQLELQKRTAA